MEMQHSTYISLADLFFIISAAEECKEQSLHTYGRLNNIRNIFLVLLVIKVCQILTGYILMLCQVIIGSVCDTPQFAPSEGEQELYVCSSLGIEGKFFLVMVTVTHLVVFYSKILKPVYAELFPICKPLKVSSRLTEELKLHLLKLSCSESKVTRCNLISE